MAIFRIYKSIVLSMLILIAKNAKSDLVNQEVIAA